MRLSRAERAIMVDLLVKLGDAHRVIEDSQVIIRLGKKPSHKNAESYLRPLVEALSAIKGSVGLLSELMAPSQDFKALAESFMLESSTMDTHHVRKLAEEFTEVCLGPITVLDDIVDAIEEPEIQPRQDARAWCYIEKGRIHIEIGNPLKPNDKPEMKGSFKPSDLKKAHQFLVKANVATGLFSSSCFHPDEYGLPADFDINEWLGKARHWNG